VVGGGEKQMLFAEKRYYTRNPVLLKVRPPGMGNFAMSKDTFRVG
jgi:hypothetical protein